MINKGVKMIIATPQIPKLNSKLTEIKSNLIKKLDKALPISSSSKQKALSITTAGTTQWNNAGLASSSSALRTSTVSLKEKENLISLLKEIAKYSHHHRVDKTNSRK